MFLDSRAYCWWNRCSEPPDPSRHSVMKPHKLTHWVGTGEYIRTRVSAIYYSWQPQEARTSTSLEDPKTTLQVSYYHHHSSFFTSFRLHATEATLSAYEWKLQWTLDEQRLRDDESGEALRLNTRYQPQVDAFDLEQTPSNKRRARYTTRTSGRDNGQDQSILR